jgi:hypothetical protein
MHAEVDSYEAAADSVKQAIAGLTGDQLRAHPVPGTWSIQQIVTHLTDAEAVFADRIKRIIAEENPPIVAFDENRWMQYLAVDSRPADESAQLLELTRRQITRILREAPPTVFDRTGIHSELGPLSLGDVLKKANWHLEHHLKFLRDKRKLVLMEEAKR